MKNKKKKAESEVTDVVVTPSDEAENTEKNVSENDVPAETESAVEEITVADEENPTDEGDSDSADSKDGEAENGDEENSDVPAEKKPKKGLPSAVRYLTTVLLICAVAVGIAGGVNLFTESRADRAAAKKKSEAILALFPVGDSSKLYADTESGNEVHLVFNGENIIGYCVITSAKGYKSDIVMAVGIDPDYNTHGVRIISMNETTGIGTKVNTVEFLSKFAGKAHNTPVNGIDAVSGATVSSNAVKTGVANAHGVEFDLKAVAKELGVKIVSMDEIENESSSESTTDSTEASTVTDQSPSAGDSVSIDPTESTAQNDPTEETSDVPYSEYIPSGQDIYNVNVTSSFDRYVVEITKETNEESELILPTTEETTTAPPVSLPTITLPLVTVESQSASSPMGSVTIPENAETPTSESSSENTESPDNSSEQPEEPVSPEDLDPSENAEPEEIN